jgi:hypothetical protein
MSTEQTQRLAAMRYLLYERPLHPELFNIYNDVHLMRSGYEARIWVTGCSHVISFYADDQSMVEVIASDEEAPLPSRGRAISWPLKGERSHQRRRPDGISYMMSFQTEVMSSRVYHKVHHELARQGARRGLFVPFPMWMDQSLTPFTYISYEAKAEHLHVLAWHAFPEALTIVKTQSLFELT